MAVRWKGGYYCSIPRGCGRKRAAWELSIAVSYATSKGFACWACLVLSWVIMLVATP